MTHRRRHQRSAYWTKRYKWQQFKIWLRHRYVRNIAELIFRESPIITHIERKP